MDRPLNGPTDPQSLRPGPSVLTWTAREREVQTESLRHVGETGFKEHVRAFLEADVGKLGDEGLGPRRDGLPAR